MYRKLRNEYERIYDESDVLDVTEAMMDAGFRVRHGNRQRRRSATRKAVKYVYGDDAPLLYDYINQPV